MDIVALLLIIIGGINWGLIGIFNFDLVAFLFGGQMSAFSKIVYILVSIGALWSISFFFREKILSKFTANS